MQHLVELLAGELGTRGLKLATAESCTGGGIASACTDLAGSSAWFDCGFVTYSNEAKMKLLGVPVEILAHHGAVSEATVVAMVRGAIARSDADVAIAVSGIAGPGGGSASKPVGTVWMAWGNARRQQARCFRFTGDRLQVRAESVQAGLQALLLWLRAQP